MSNDKQHVKVYVRDQAYAWLPGSIVFIKEGKAFVRIELPQNWHSSTALCQDSGLEAVEEALAANNNDNDGDDNNKTSNAVRAVPLASYPNGQLPLQNKCGHKSNMTSLPHLHEAAMLYNLKERNTIGKPYTRVRDVIVAMNPFAPIEKLYSLETQRFYAQQLVWGKVGNSMSEEEKKEDSINSDVEPHIYEVACLAYRGLTVDNQDQTILTTGESGSGKTETVKILLNHLATLESLRPFNNRTPRPSGLNIVNKVMHSSAVLEAFGNAQTRRNDNSSRFGKLAQLQFKIESEGDFNNNSVLPTCSLIGSVCTTYLLEKSRVVSHAVGERSFHIFYQLLASPEEFKQNLWSFFAPQLATNFSYLSQYGECDIEDSDDRDKWGRTLEAFRQFNIQGDLLLTIMRTIAIVLQLGNLQFDEGHADSGERETVITSEGSLGTLGKMLGIEQDKLETALTSRSIKTNFEELRAPVRPALAKEATDALAKEIYSKAFGFVVRHVNEQMKAENDDDICGTINLVDIYGFERLAINRFEQLCINYANEQLQQKYVADNFRILKEEYDNEGIDIFDFSLVDNSQILHLIDGRTGVFVALQEECARPMGNDESFVEKVKSTNNTHPHLISEKLHSKTEFGIRHFAGPVTYDATKFVERNMDKIPEELLSCASQSSNTLIRSEMQKVSQKRTTKSKPDDTPRMSGLSTIEKFSIELRDLLIAMEGTQTRYIRCIIPNETKAPGVTNHLMALRQLEYAGLMTSVALTRESLPDSLSYKTLITRFGLLLKKEDRQKMNEMPIADQIVYLLTNLFMSSLRAEEAASMPFACGRTKAYLRAGALEHLERLRYRFYYFKAVAIQSWIRAIQGTKQYRQLRASAIKVQSVVRIRLAQGRARKCKSAALLLSSWLQRQRQAKLSHRANLAARTIQSMWRAKLASSKYRTFRMAAITIQRKHRWSYQLPKETMDDDESTMHVGNQEDQVTDEENSQEGHGPSDIVAIKKRIALRQVALPRYRRADHELLAEIDSLLTTICDRASPEQTPADSDSSSSLDELEFLQGENESLRNECRHLQERTRILSETIEDLQTQPSIDVPENMKEEIDKWKKKVENEAQQLRNMAEARESEIQRLKNELELAHQHNQDLISHATESQEAREELTREIASVNAHLGAEEQKRRDAVQLLQQQLSENQALRDKETTKLKEELNMIQQLNLASSSQLLESKEAHAKEIADMKAKLLECSSEKTSLEEKLERQEQSFRAEKEELCKMMTDSEAKETEYSTLKEKLQLQEENSRAEKEEIWKMMKEAEEQYQEEIRNLKAQVASRNETQEKLQSEVESVRAHLENEAKEKVEALETKNASLEKELKKKEQMVRDKLEEMSMKLKAMEERHASEKSLLQTQLDTAQETQRGMKTELSRLQASHALEQEKMMSELIGYHQKEAEGVTWQEKLRQQEEKAKLEETRLKEAVENAENKYREEIRELREELFWTQESERQLKSEISEMEASHAEEMEKLNTDAFDDCNKVNEDMVMLQKTLERQEQASRAEKEELCKMLKDAEESHQKEALKLNDEIFRLQESLKEVKSEAAKLAKEIEKLMTKNFDYSGKDEEIANLQAKVNAQEDMFRQEKERLRGWLKNHLDDVRGLKVEFTEAQESHIMHLLHVLAELEAIETKRAEEIDAVLNDLEEMRKEKDATIERLTTELELKRGLPGLGLPPNLPTISEAGEVSVGELRELEERLAKNSSERASHSDEFNETLFKLQMAIKPDNLKYIIKKIQRKQDSYLETKVFTEIHRMSVKLGDLYSLEEHAQQLLNDDMLSFIRRSGSSSDAGQSEDGKESQQAEATTDPGQLLRDLQQRVSAIEKQNSSLKEQLKASEDRNRNAFVLDPFGSPRRTTSSSGTKGRKGVRSGKDA